MEDYFTPSSSANTTNNRQHQEEELTAPSADVHTTISQRPRRLPRLSETNNVETPSRNFSRSIENNYKQPSQKEIHTNTAGVRRASS